MSRKYQVFISSSFIDLKQARQELIMATLREGHIPFGMEMLKPGFQRSLTVIEEKIAESDIFVVLIGARLGSHIDKRPDSLAFTEQEYEYALKHRKPIIAFLLDNEDFKKARDNIPSDSSERKDEEGLRNFRERVKKVEDGSRIVGHFFYDNISAFADQYSRAIADCTSYLEKEGPQGGWVKGDEFDALNRRIHLDTSVSNNPFFRDLAQNLNRFEKLSNRTIIADNLKKGIASYFWRRYFAKLHTKKIQTIFFESGSSIAYVSREFINQIHRQSYWFHEERMNEMIRIRTNNVLTYLDFLFQESPWHPMDVRLLPHGPFSDDYGGTYGILNFAVQEAAPSPKDALRTKLPQNTQKLVDRVTDEFTTEFKEKGLILMAASGVDSREESKEVPYPGPHVGSYPNMLLKRCLLALPCPKVLFLHPKKWDFDFRFNSCHAVCDKSFPWSTVKLDFPLAIAIATETEDHQQKLSTKLCDYGFSDIDLEEPLAGSIGPWAIIAANSKFTDFFRVMSTT